MENQELISTLVHALELALSAGEIVLVGSHESEGLTEENKEWLASLIYDEEDEEDDILSEMIDNYEAEEEDDEEVNEEEEEADEADEEEEVDEFDKALAVAAEMLKSSELKEMLKVLLSY